jgi:hypothetical protein
LLSGGGVKNNLGGPPLYYPYAHVCVQSYEEWHLSTTVYRQIISGSHLIQIS